MTLALANSQDIAIGHGETAIDTGDFAVDFEDDFSPPPLPPTPWPQTIRTAPLFALNTALPQSPSPFSPPPTPLPSSFAPPPRPLFSSLFNPAVPPFAPVLAPILGPLVAASVAPITVSCHFGLWTTGQMAATKKEAEDLVLLVVREQFWLLSQLREIGCTSLRIINGFHISDDPRSHLTIHKLDSKGDRLGCPLHVYRDGMEPRYSLYPPPERRLSSRSRSGRRPSEGNLERRVSESGSAGGRPSGNDGLARRMSSRRGRARGGSAGGMSTGGGSRRESEAGGGSL